MKKDKITLVLMGVIASTSFTTLNASCLSEYSKNGNISEYSNCTEQEERNSMSYQERSVYDMEKENDLKRRQVAAKEENKRLEQDRKDAEYEAKSPLDKAKSWFD